LETRWCFTSYSSHISSTSKPVNITPSSVVPPTTDADLEKKRTVYHAAQIIKKSEIKTCQGIEIQPLDTEDLTLNRAKALIPDSLMKFLSWVIVQQPVASGDNMDVTPSLNHADKRHAIMIGQDTLHSATHGRVKTPKHVGLAMMIRHLTESKQLTTMLNRTGYCSSYDEVEAVDTSLTMEVVATSEKMGVIIPSNVNPGGFIQVTADNDINKETLDGKQTTHATTIVLFQRGQFGLLTKPPKLARHSLKKRSLAKTSVLQPVYECSAYGRRPPVNSFVNKVDVSWYRGHGSLDLDAQKKDTAWSLLQHCSTVFCQVDLASSDSAPSPVPGWTGFNAIVSSSAPALTSIGYCPMIAAS